jgi:hypothetical protein
MEDKLRTQLLTEVKTEVDKILEEIKDFKLESGRIKNENTDLRKLQEIGLKEICPQVPPRETPTTSQDAQTEDIQISQSSQEGQTQSHQPQTPPLRTPNRTIQNPGALYVRPPIVRKICKLGHGKLLTQIEQDFAEVINDAI